MNNKVKRGNGKGKLPRGAYWNGKRYVKRSDPEWTAAGYKKATGEAWTASKKPSKCLNWWPGRGPMPKRLREPKYKLPSPIVKDMPFQRPMMASIEKTTIEAMLTGDENTLKELNAFPSKPKKPIKRISKTKLKKWKAKFKKDRYYNDFFLNHHVESVASIPFETARRVIMGATPKDRHFIALEIEPKPITITLDYPLSRAVMITVKPYEWKGHKFMDLGYVLWVVAQQYKRIYKQHKRYGVWGHMLDDLWFERLTIKNGRGELFIGS